MRNRLRKNYENQEHLKQKVMLFLIMGVLLTAAAFPITSQAASAKWKKACKAYNTWLSKNNSKFTAKEFDFSTKNTENYKKADRFMIVDLDKNGVLELVVTHPVAYKSDNIYVYTYKSGKVAQAKDTFGRKGETAAVSINCQASGGYEVYKCRKKHLHVDRKSVGRERVCLYV